jgi:hypothetical protein
MIIGTNSLDDYSRVNHRLNQTDLNIGFPANSETDFNERKANALSANFDMRSVFNPDQSILDDLNQSRPTFKRNATNVYIDE